MNVELLTHTYVGGNSSVCLYTCIHSILGFPHGSVVKNLPANAGDRRDVGSVPGSGRSPGGGHGNPLQYSCLESSVDRGVSWPTVREVAKHTCTHPLHYQAKSQRIRTGYEWLTNIET